jgi:hypothetical protein
MLLQSFLGHSDTYPVLAYVYTYLCQFIRARNLDAPAVILDVAHHLFCRVYDSKTVRSGVTLSLLY